MSELSSNAFVVISLLTRGDLKVPTVCAVVAPSNDSNTQKPQVGALSPGSAVGTIPVWSLGRSAKTLSP